jgi:plastocyanin
MAIPRILFALPLLAAGAFLPAAGADPPAAPAGVVGMAHEVFTINEISVRRGDTLTLVNNSRWLHIIGPGEGGTLTAAKGNPMNLRVLTEINDSYTTPAWQDDGTYYLTCSIHPDMTVKVVVNDCGCCSQGCG